MVRTYKRKVVSEIELNMSNDAASKKGVKSLTISRGEQPEYSVDFDLIENLVIFDETGKEVRVGDIYKNKKTILILIRHFLCFICKEYVDDLALIPDSYLKEADVQLVVIGCADWKFIEPFRLTTCYLGPLYVDPERNLYKALECKEKLNLGHYKESKHVKSGFLSGIIQSTWRGMKYREFQGDIDQQGAAFILGPGNTVSFSHIDETAKDHTPINDLLALAGVSQVNFDKYTRVLTI